MSTCQCLFHDEMDLFALTSAASIARAKSFGVDPLPPPFRQLHQKTRLPRT